MRVLILAAAVTTVLAVPANATVIDQGTITVNRGVNGARLGMTRAQVIDALGTPEYTNRNGLMEYSGDDSHIFDLFLGRRSHRLNLIEMSEGAFTLEDGNHIFRRGAVRRLFRTFGDRVERNPIYQGSRSYSVNGRLHGRKVSTTFTVPRYKRSAPALEVWISYR
jgi:hypothetical protein